MLNGLVAAKFPGHLVRVVFKRNRSDRVDEAPQNASDFGRRLRIIADPANAFTNLRFISRRGHFWLDKNDANPIYCKDGKPGPMCLQDSAIVFADTRLPVPWQV
jgi:hypothetical protein